MKVIIVGGVAGGASCAARLRRLDEAAEILVVERGPFISYANCGLPYYVGGVIPRESKLVLADAALFRAQLNVEVRTLLRGRLDLARGEDPRPPRRHDRRGDHRGVRHAGPVAGRHPDPAAPPRHRPAGHLRRPNRARCACDPRVDGGPRLRSFRARHLHRLPDDRAGAARGRRRRRLHRARDGREPCPPRSRRHAGPAWSTSSCRRWTPRWPTMSSGI